MAEMKLLNATDCASRAGKFAYGLDETKAVELLRRLADDLESGKVTLQSVSTSCHATQEEFAVREIVIELLEEYAEPEIPSAAGPRIIKK